MMISEIERERDKEKRDQSVEFQDVFNRCCVVQIEGKKTNSLWSKLPGATEGLSAPVTYIASLQSSATSTTITYHDLNLPSISPWSLQQKPLTYWW